MSHKTEWKPAALMSPCPPALVSCGTESRPNILTIAWTGITCTHPPMTYISVRPSRFSYGIIKKSGEFVINLTTPALVRAADFCGVRSGASVDKFAAMGLTAERSFKVSAPSLAESPLCLECKVRKIIPLGSHDMFLSEIVAVSADERCLDERGRLDLGRCGVAAYSHGEYFALGKRLGSFGFSVKKKGKRTTRNGKTG